MRRLQHLKGFKRIVNRFCIVFRVILFLLYSNCFCLRLLVSLIAFASSWSHVRRTLLSFTFLDSPIVCISEVSERRNPSLSASSIATRDASVGQVLHVNLCQHAHQKPPSQIPDNFLRSRVSTWNADRTFISTSLR